MGRWVDPSVRPMGIYVNRPSGLDSPTGSLARRAGLQELVRHGGEAMPVDDGADPVEIGDGVGVEGEDHVLQSTDGGGTPLAMISTHAHQLY